MAVGPIPTGYGVSISILKHAAVKITFVFCLIAFFPSFLEIVSATLISFLPSFKQEKHWFII